MEDQQQQHCRIEQLESQGMVIMKRPDDAVSRHLVGQEDKMCDGRVYSDESTLPLPMASCSNSDRVRDVDDQQEATTSQRSIKQVPKRKQRQSWNDCQPHVVLLREALLSSAPDIAVLGPLNGCFSFYMTHLHNEVLTSTYANTMFFGANVTPLESGFMWMGGWRPTSALVLVYSLMGIEIENALQTVRSGRNMSNGSTVSVLSTRQLSVMHMLQKHTQNAELKISKKLSVLQMLIGDQDMLEAVLLDAASPIPNDSSRFNRAKAKRMSRFRRVLIQAEELRLHTLQDLLSLLTPIQAARCGVAVFEICSSLREMGSSTLPPRFPFLTMFPRPARSPVGRSLPSDALPSDRDNLMNPYHITAKKDGTSDNSALLVPSCSSSSFSLPPRQVSSSSGPPRDTHLVTRSSSFGPLLLEDHQGTETAVVGLPIPEFSAGNRGAPPELHHWTEEALSFGERSSSFGPQLLDNHQGTETAVAGMSTPDSSASNRSAPSELHHRTEGASSFGELVDKKITRLHDTSEGAFMASTHESEKMVLSRLLILSPSSSDVAIQTCNLNTENLPSFELHGHLQIAASPDFQRTNDVSASTGADELGWR